MITLKVQTKGEIRRINVSDSFSYLSVIEALRKYFLSLPNTFSLQYKDEDEDIISVSSQAEYQEAKRIMKNSLVLRFYVHELPSSEVSFQSHIYSNDPQQIFTLEDSFSLVPRSRVEEVKYWLQKTSIILYIAPQINERI